MVIKLGSCVWLKICKDKLKQLPDFLKIASETDSVIVSTLKLVFHPSITVHLNYPIKLISMFVYIVEKGRGYSI